MIIKRDIWLQFNDKSTSSLITFSSIINSQFLKDFKSNGIFHIDMLGEVSVMVNPNCQFDKIQDHHGNMSLGVRVSPEMFN